MNEINTGSQLCEWRKINNISRKDLAEKINYSYTRVARIESQDLKVSEKIIKQVKEIDSQLHPAMEQISIKWDKLKEYHTFFDEEIDLIEKNLLELLSVNVNKLGISGTAAYLKFIGLSLGDLIKVVTSDFIDKEHYKNEVLPYIQHINTEAKVYLNSK